MANRDEASPLRDIHMLIVSKNIGCPLSWNSRLLRKCGGGSFNMKLLHLWFRLQGDDQTPRLDNHYDSQNLTCMLDAAWGRKTSLYLSSSFFLAVNCRSGFPLLKYVTLTTRPGLWHRITRTQHEPGDETAMSKIIIIRDYIQFLGENNA